MTSIGFPDTTREHVARARTIALLRPLLPDARRQRSVCWAAKAHRRRAADARRSKSCEILTRSLRIVAWRPPLSPPPRGLHEGSLGTFSRNTMNALGMPDSYRVE